MSPKCFVCQTMPRAVATRTFGPRVGTTLGYTVHNKTQGPSDCSYCNTANKTWKAICLTQWDRSLLVYSSSLCKVLHDLRWGGGRGVIWCRYLVSNWSIWVNWSFLPAATKLGQGNVFTGICDSVHRGGGGLSASVHAGIPHPLGADTPWEQTHTPQEQTLPWEQTTSGADTPPEQTHPPGADTPQEQTPPGNRHIPPRKQTPAYGQRASSTHPTGMHSCWQHFPHTQDSHRYLGNCQMQRQKKNWFRRAQTPPSCIINVIDHSGRQMCLLGRHMTYLALLWPFQQLRVLFSSAAPELQILWGKSFQKSLAISTFPLISRTKRSNDVPAAVVGRTICCWLCFLPGFHPKEKSS